MIVNIISDGKIINEEPIQCLGAYLAIRNNKGEGNYVVVTGGFEVNMAVIYKWFIYINEESVELRKTRDIVHTVTPIKEDSESYMQLLISYFRLFDFNFKYLILVESTNSGSPYQSYYGVVDTWHWNDK